MPDRPIPSHRSKVYVDVTGTDGRRAAVMRWNPTMKDRRRPCLRFGFRHAAAKATTSPISIKAELSPWRSEPAGGSYDIYAPARPSSRQAHSGNPSIIIQNRPGAAQLYLLCL